MLGKLIKYDMRAISRILIPLHAVILLLTLLGKAAIKLDESFPLPTAVIVISILVYTLYITGAMIATLVILLHHFYKNMFTSEGYLTFTLPATTEQHLLSKLITAFIWFLIDMAVVFFSFAFIVFSPSDFREFVNTIGLMNKEIIAATGIHVFDEFVPITAISILLSGIVSFISFYMCLAIGQLSNQHKVVWGLVTYFGLSMVERILSLVFVFAYGNITDFDVFGTYDEYSGFLSAIRFFEASMIWTAVFSAVLIVISWFVTNHILKKKLNLA